MVQRMRELIVYGGASQKIIANLVIDENTSLDENLMNFLMMHEIPVASSCLGEGICKKCVALIHEKKWLTCELTLAQLFLSSRIEKVSFSYL
jgi:ferredoxin